jgi:hypothetical protein
VVSLHPCRYVPRWYSLVGLGGPQSWLGLRGSYLGSNPVAVPDASDVCTVVRSDDHLDKGFT